MKMPVNVQVSHRPRQYNETAVPQVRAGRQPLDGGKNLLQKARMKNKEGSFMKRISKGVWARATH